MTDDTDRPLWVVRKSKPFLLPEYFMLDLGNSHGRIRAVDAIDAFIKELEKAKKAWNEYGG
jgi:hypothetical protein